MGLLAFAFMISCGGPPQNNPLLTEAEQIYRQAEQDSLIVLKAPVPLKEAEEHLETSREIWEEKGDKQLVDHYAYLAKRKTQIAEETAKLNAAQDQVERAESERKEVLLEARRAEAEAAERRANEALAELQSTQRRAEEMAARISELEARQTERGLVLTLSDVLFDFNKAELKPGANSVVRELTNFMNEYPNRTILIEGHTDSIGSDEYNESLSRRRALSLKDALMKNGISAGRIQTVGLGEQYPVASNMNEAGRQQNRRVEIVVSDESGRVTQRSN